MSDSTENSILSNKIEQARRNVECLYKVANGTYTSGTDHNSDIYKLYMKVLTSNVKIMAETDKL